MPDWLFSRRAPRAASAVGDGKMAAGSSSGGGGPGDACRHHAQLGVCESRAKYREGRRPRAVKVGPAGASRAPRHALPLRGGRRREAVSGSLRPPSLLAAVSRSCPAEIPPPPPPAAAPLALRCRHLSPFGMFPVLSLRPGRGLGLYCAKLPRPDDLCSKNQPARGEELAVWDRKITAETWVYFSEELLRHFTAFSSQLPCGSCCAPFRGRALLCGAVGPCHKGLKP